MFFRYARIALSGYMTFVSHSNVFLQLTYLTENCWCTVQNSLI